MSVKNFSVSNTISFGWDEFKNNYTFWLGLSMITLFLGAFSDTQSIAEYVGVNITIPSLSSFIIGLLATYVSLAIYKISIEQIRGNQVNFNDLTNISLNQYINYLIGATITGILVIIGIILFIVPGFYIAIRLMFLPYLIADKNLKFNEALKESWRITEGNVWNLFSFGVAAIFIAIAGLLVVFVGLLAALPVLWLATAKIYLLFTEKEEELLTE